MPATTTAPPTKGLQDVVAGESKICYIDGDRGVLAYRGIDIHELATKSNFEEVCYLLWYGKLPNKQELSSFRQKLASERKVDGKVIDFLRQFPKSAIPMEVLRTAVSYLSPYDAER
jgi:citrate synthase